MIKGLRFSQDSVVIVRKILVDSKTDAKVNSKMCTSYDGTYKMSLAHCLSHNIYVIFYYFVRFFLLHPIFQYICKVIRFFLGPSNVVVFESLEERLPNRSLAS